LRESHCRLSRPVNTPDGRDTMGLERIYRCDKLLRPVKAAEGRDVIEFWPRYRDLRLLNPEKAPT